MTHFSLKTSKYCNIYYNIMTFYISWLTHTLLLKELPLHRNNKFLKHPQETLVVPGGALGTQARRSAEEDTRRRSSRRSASPVDMCTAEALSQSIVIKTPRYGRCRNTSLKQDKWCVMWLALVRLFIVRFKGQFSVSNYAPSRDAAASAWVTVHWSPQAWNTPCISYHLSPLKSIHSVWAQTE